MKWKSYVTDVATTVSCVVGVGFVSGKELAEFVQNWQNTIVFGVVFFAFNTVVRLLCCKRNLACTHALNKHCFGKLGGFFDLVFATCCFVSLVTILAGVQKIGATLWRFCDNAPIFAIAVALLAFVALSKKQCLANVCAIAFALAISYVALLAILAKNTAPQPTPPPYQTERSWFAAPCYALVSTTTSLGVTTKLAVGKSAKQNVALSAISSLLVALLMLAVLEQCNFALPLPALGNITSTATKIATIVCIVVCSTCGVAANAIPALEELQSVVTSKIWCKMALLGVAVALSLLGFDFLLRFGYAFVAIIGVIILVATAIRSAKSTTIAKTCKEQPS